MKKFLCFFVFAVLLSCSGDDSSSTDPNNENPNEPAHLLNPPAWLMGDWKYEFGAGSFGDLRFKEHDICPLVDGEESQCALHLYETLINVDANVTVTETITSTEYIVTSNVGVNYHFKLIAPDVIDYVNDSSGNNLLRL